MPGDGDDTLWGYLSGKIPWSRIKGDPALYRDVSRAITRTARPESVKAALEFWKRETKLPVGFSREQHLAMGRVLAEGMARGWNPVETARHLSMVTELDRVRQAQLNKFAEAAEKKYGVDGAAGRIAKREEQLLRKRRLAIAQYEQREAQQAGHEEYERGMGAKWKRWVTVGDERVRDEHLANEAAGWIPIDDTFPSGDDRPPGGVKCRCSCAYRTQAPSEAAQKRAKQKAISTAVQKGMAGEVEDLASFDGFARILGVQTEGFEDASGAVRRVTAEALSMLQAKGHQLPGTLMAARGRFGPDDPAWYDPTTGTVGLELSANAWKGSAEAIADFANKQRRLGVLSTSAVHHALFHEMGHFLHDETASQAFQRAKGMPVPTDLKELVVDEVSEYAIESAGEFVAEMFAGRLAGVPYSKTLLAWYNELGGPKIR